MEPPSKRVVSSPSTALVVPDLADGVTLTDVQSEAVQWMLNNTSSIFALSMGLGKTLSTLASSSVHASKRTPGTPYRVLVCLRSMSQASNWKNDIATLLKPGSFVIHDCLSDDARIPTPKDKPVIVFSTLNRLLRCFKEAAKSVPEGTVEVPTKKRARKSSAPDEEDKLPHNKATLSLMNAILGTQGRNSRRGR